jgi:hypothetical protein
MRSGSSALPDGYPCITWLRLPQPDLEPVTKPSEESQPNQYPAFGPRWAQVRVRVDGKYVVAVRELETQTARCESSDPAQPLALGKFCE